MAGVRKVFQMKLGTEKHPMKAEIKDDLQTGQSPKVISYKIAVGATQQDYDLDVSFAYDISLMGGRFTIGPEHHLDSVKFIIDPGGANEFETVNVEMYNTGSECIVREIGDLKQGGTTIPANTTIRLKYVNNTGGSARDFICEMELSL